MNYFLINRKETKNMSLSKKHFNNISKILNNNWNREESNFSDNIVVDLGLYFQTENKNFNSTKWVDACYKKNKSEGQ